MFSYACRDLGVECDFVTNAESVEEVKKATFAHAGVAHQEMLAKMTPAQLAELEKAVEGAIKTTQGSVNPAHADMTTNKSAWADTLIHLFALASRLEGEGQYNLAKLARAAADSLSRQAAYQMDIPPDKDKLAADIQQAIEALSRFHVNANLLSALERGADMMAEGRLPLITVTPHAYVCRTCGHLALTEPVEKCPTCGAWPGTFQRFLPVYWLDALEPPAAMQRLHQTPLEVEKLLQGWSKAALNQPPQDGGWSIRNILSHLRDAQGVLDFRLDLFLKEEHPILESKAVFSWATKEENRPPSALEIFESYQTSRNETIRKLEHLPFADWWRSGQHEEFGVVTLRQQVSYFASHEITHLPQIESLRNQLVAGNQ